MVVMVAPSYPPNLGGIQFFTKALAEKISWNVDLEVWTETMEAKSEKVSFRYFKASRRISLMWGFAKALWKEKPSCLVLLDPGNTAELSLVAKFLGIKCISYFHGKEYLNASLFRKFLLCLCASFSKTLVNSHYTKKNLTEDLFGFCFADAEVAYPFTNNGKDFPLSESSKKRFVSWGRWEKRKGVDKLIELSKILPLAVMGNGIEAHKFKNVPNVDWYPPMELQKFLKSGDIALFPFQEIPKDIEGFGLVVAEAIDLGLPTFITRSCGIYELLGDESLIENGLKTHFKISNQKNKLKNLEQETVEIFLSLLK